MSTLNEMIDEVRQSLSGYTLKQERINYLNAALTSSATTFTVGDTSNFAKGVIEIDDELLYAVSFNTGNNTVNLAPGFGRGYDGTVAAAHAQYSKVIFAPTFPRIAVKRAINDTIGSVFPNLFATTYQTFTFNAATTTYALSDDAETVLSVSWETLGSSKEWLPIKRWRQDSLASVSSFNSNNTISIYDSVAPGRTVQVWYTQAPVKLENGTDNFVDVSGLPESCRDVITWGAAYRLAAYQDAGRIGLTSPEADLQDSKVPSNAAQGLSRFFYTNYQLRLAEESAKLKDRNPIRLHYTVQGKLMARIYKSTSTDTTLTSTLSAGAGNTTAVVADAAALLAGATISSPDTFTIAIDPDTASEEICLITARASNTLTITRAQAGTSAVEHLSGATVRHVLTSLELTDFETVKSNYVSASGAATLTTKTIDLASNTVTGTLAQFNTALSDANFVSIAGAETLTSKTLTTPVISIGLNAQTAAYTLVATDKNKLVTITSASTANLTVPSGVFSAGDVIYFARMGTGAVAATASGTTVNGTPGLNLRAQYSTAALICTASNTFLLVGDLAA